MDLRLAENLAKEKMAQWGLSGWAFKWDNARNRFGQCRYLSAEISLSRHLVSVNDEARVLNTILHEIAHAKAETEVRGLGMRRAGHGPYWRKWCRIVGIEPRRCFDSTNTKTLEPRWIRYCPNGHEHGVERRSSKRFSCATCGNGRFNEALILKYKPNPNWREA